MNCRCGGEPHEHLNDLQAVPTQSLKEYIDIRQCKALNVIKPIDLEGVLTIDASSSRPLVSEDDGEFILKIQYSLVSNPTLSFFRFTSFVKITAIGIRGGSQGSSPGDLMAYKPPATLAL